MTDNVNANPADAPAPAPTPAPTASQEYEASLWRQAADDALAAASPEQRDLIGEYSVAEWGAIVDPAERAALADVARISKIGPGELGTMLREWGEVHSKVPAQDRGKQWTNEEATARLRQLWGPAFESKLQIVRTYARETFGPTFIDFMERQGMGNDPHALNWLAQRAEAGSGIEQQIQAIIRSPEYARGNVNSADWQMLNARLQQLYARRYGTATVGND